MTPQEFAQDAKSRIEQAGYTVGYEHTFVDGTVYLASLETVHGCLGQPQAEAQMWPDGRTFYTEIVTLYLTDEDARGTGLLAGWYYETNETDVPQGPYQTQGDAEQAALNYKPEE